MSRLHGSHYQNRISRRESEKMTISEFSKFVTEMIRDEKETFVDFIENEDWESLECVIYECVVNCVEG